MQATMRRLTRYLARRLAWHMLGGAIGLAVALVAYAVAHSAFVGMPGWTVAALGVVAAAALGMVPGARELEVTAARALLEVDSELVVPDRPRPAHRVRTALWVLGHLATGMVVAAGLFALVPGAVLIGLEAVAGRSLGSEIPLPVGAVDTMARLVACVVAGAVGITLTWPLGAAASALACRVLGPTAQDRMETALARASREAEHTRLARELHDGIGHALTVVSVQAAAGRRVVATNPEAAGDALAAIQDTARTALTELDQLLAVLRDDAADDAPAPLQPALDDVVAAHRRAGLDLTAHIDLPDGLPALLGRTVQRIVTEALTNAHRHGTPGPVGLTVAHHDDGIRIEAVNLVRGPGSGSGAGVARFGSGRRRESGGRGLAGVRERVALFGGTVQAGPDGDSWVLRATLPCAPVDARTDGDARADSDAPTGSDAREDRKDPDA